MSFLLIWEKLLWISFDGEGEGRYKGRGLWEEEGLGRRYKGLVVICYGEFWWIEILDRFTLRDDGEEDS